MRLTTILILIFAAAAVAGPNNPGTTAEQVTTIWSAQAITTTMITSSNYHQVGLDRSILVEFNVREVDPGGGVTMNITPIWQGPAGAPIGYASPELENTQVLNWSALRPPGYPYRLSPPPGAERLYFQTDTSDPNVAYLTLKCTGSP